MTQDIRNDSPEGELRPLVCFARGRPGAWEAICLTFDIAVQGSSEDEVQASLREAIAAFVQAAKSERDPGVRQSLLQRRAPLGVWFRCSSSFVLHVAFSRFRRADDYSEAGFVMPCPA